MIDTPASNTVAGDQLRNYVERAERLNAEKDGINSDLSDLFKEMKGEGFDTKAVKRLIAIRRKDVAQVQEEEAILDMYKSALGMLD